MSLTWKNFRAKVLEDLPLDSQRVGTETFIQNQIRVAVMEIQGLIEFYRRGHESTYEPADLTTHGSASVGKLAADAAVRSADILMTDDSCVCNRHPCKDFTWVNRYLLVAGQVHLPDNNGLLSIAPNGATFYVFPKIVASKVIGSKTYSYKLHIEWDGVRLDWSDNECTPFGEQEANCVRYFVKGQLAREVQKDREMFRSHMADYVHARRTLFLNAKERTSVK